MENTNYSKLFSKLPARLKAAIQSADTAGAIETIHRKHKLHIDQLEPLENLTLDVLYGLIRPDDYVGKVAEALGLEDHEAASIAVDMNALVFQPVRTELMAIPTQGEAIGTATASDPEDAAGMLQAIQNPAPTPLSGSWTQGEQVADGRLQMADGNAPTTASGGQKTDGNTDGEDARTTPDSILEEKSGGGRRGVPGEDPYLEPVN